MVKVKDFIDDNCSVDNRGKILLTELYMKLIVSPALTVVDRKLRVELKDKVTVMLVGKCAHCKIPQSYIGCMEKRHIAMYSGKTPEILIFEI